MPDQQRLRIFIFLYSAYIYLNAIADFPTDVFTQNVVYPWSQLLIPLVAMLALVCVISPGIGVFSLLLAINLVSYTYRMPAPGNHDLLGFFLELSFLVTAGMWWLGRSARDVGHLFRVWTPVGRMSLLVLYFYAVLHKLNLDYLNPALSCGSVFVDLMRARPLSFLPEPGPWMRYGAILGSLVVEALIPVLLLLEGRVLYGVLLGTCFHLVLGYHFFWHFTPLLFALYFLFIPADSLKHLVPHISLDGFKYHLPRVMLLLLVVAILEGCSRAIHWHSIQPWFVPSWSIETIFGWIPFLILSYLVASCTVLMTRQAPASAAEPLIPSSPLLLAFPLGVLLVGALPYLGYSSMLSFTMFSGLRTENGQSNHVWITPALQVSDNLRDVVEPLHFSSNLMPYLKVMERRTDIQGRLYPLLALHKLVAMAKADGIKDIQVVFVHHGQQIDIRNAETHPMFEETPSLLERKLFKFRAGPKPGWAERCAY